MWPDKPISLGHQTREQFFHQRSSIRKWVWVFFHLKSSLFFLGFNSKFFQKRIELAPSGCYCCGSVSIHRLGAWNGFETTFLEGLFNYHSQNWFPSITGYNELYVRQIKSSCTASIGVTSTLSAYQPLQPPWGVCSHHVWGNGILYSSGV